MLGPRVRRKRHRATASLLRAEISEALTSERAAQDAELRLLAAAGRGDAELRTLRGELAESEVLGSKLAALAGRGR